MWVMALKRITELWGLFLDFSGQAHRNHNLLQYYHCFTFSESERQHTHTHTCAHTHISPTPCHDSVVFMLLFPQIHSIELFFHSIEIYSIDAPWKEKERERKGKRKEGWLSKLAWEILGEPEFKRFLYYRTSQSLCLVHCKSPVWAQSKQDLTEI